MSGLIEETVEQSDSTEKYLVKAFGQSDYTLDGLEEENIRVQNAQRPGQLIARGNGTVKDSDGNVVIDNSEVYSRLLLDEADDGIVVWVKEPT